MVQVKHNINFISTSDISGKVHL